VELDLMDPLANFLYAKPSFVEGWARLFDFGGVLNEYNAVKSGADADRLAIALDWYMVGQDLRTVIIGCLKQQLAEKGRGEKQEQKSGRTKPAKSAATCGSTR
jgi:hypothetical protein